MAYIKKIEMIVIAKKNMVNKKMLVKVVPICSAGNNWERNYSVALRLQLKMFRKQIWTGNGRNFTKIDRIKTKNRTENGIHAVKENLKVI